MAKYMHIHTGSVDTKGGWLASYTPEELERRELSAKAAFAEDEGVILVRVTRKKGEWVEKK